MLDRLGESESEVTQSCPTLCYLVDCSPSGSSIHGILQARILEWVSISFSRGSSRPKDQTQVSYIAGRPLSYQSSRGNSGEEVLVKMILAKKNSRKIKRYKKAQQALRRLICLKQSFLHPCLQKPIVRLSANLLPLSIFYLDFQIHFLASSCFMTFYGTENHRLQMLQLSCREYSHCPPLGRAGGTYYHNQGLECRVLGFSIIRKTAHLGFISVSKMQHPWSCDVVVEG